MKRVTLMCMLLIVPSVALGAETALPLELVLGAVDDGVLTLEQAVTLAIHNNRLVKNAALEVEKSEERVGAARTQRWPVLKLNALESRLLTPVDFEFKTGAFGTFPATGPIPDTDTKIRTEPRFNTFIIGSVAQPLSQLYRIGLGIQQLETSREMTREDLRSQRQSVVNDVKRAYYGILQTQSTLRAAEESIKYLRELDRLVENYVSEQVVLKSESLDVKARLARAEYDAFTLRNSMLSQKEQLNNLLGRDIRQEFRVEEAPDATPFESDVAAARERALKQRPELNTARLRVKQAQYDLRIKKAEYIPDLSLTLNYISPVNIEVLPQNVVAVGLQLSWEVFDWGRKSREMAERRKAIEQADIQLREAEPRILLEVNSKLRKLQEVRALLRVSQLAREAEQERVRVTMNKFKEQAALLKDVLQAQASLADANRQHQQALLSFWTARADFEKTLGEE